MLKGLSQGSVTASATCWAGVHAKSSGTAMDVCPGPASGCLSFSLGSGFCHYLLPSAVQASFSKFEVVVISLQIFKLNYIYIHIYNIYKYILYFLCS